MRRKFERFEDFYRFYLTMHRHPANRRWHLAGYTGSILCFVVFCISWQWPWLLLTPVIGHGFGWIGHGLYERNIPVVICYPVRAFIAESKMLYEVFMLGQDPERK